MEETTNLRTEYLVEGFNLKATTRVWFQYSSYGNKNTAIEQLILARKKHPWYTFRLKEVFIVECYTLYDY